MKRTFLILCAAMLFPIFAGAQSHKIGIVDSQKVLSEMPEMKSMQSELDNLAKKYEDTLVQLQKEFQTKYQDFVKEQETMVESIMWLSRICRRSR